MTKLSPFEHNALLRYVLPSWKMQGMAWTMETAIKLREARKALSAKGLIEADRFGSYKITKSGRDALQLERPD